MRCKSDTILTDRQTELSNCNFVKACLMLLIVFYHSILFWKGDWFTAIPANTVGVLAILSEYLNSFHIYTFVFVSGYIYYFLRCEKGKYEKFGAFVFNKFKRLIIPYIFVAVIYVIPISEIFFHNGIVDILKKYALGTSPSQLWFLLMLFLLFVIFWPLTGFFQKHNFWSLFIGAVFYGVGILGGILTPNVFQIWTAFKYIIIFLIGFKFRQMSDNNIIRKIPFYVWFFLHMILFVVSSIIENYDSPIISLLRLALGFAIHIIGAIMAFVILQKIASVSCFKNSKCFALLSRYSMPIYLFHQQIIYVCIYIFNGLINPYLNAVLNFIFAMALSMLLSYVLMKFKPTRFLLGEK